MQKTWCLLLCVLCVGCGRNYGTVRAPNAGSSENACASAKTDSDVSRTVLAKGHAWRLRFRWSIGPVFNERQFVENALQLDFMSPEGVPANSVSNVVVVPFVPQRGLGAGNRKPKATACGQNAVEVSEILFTMTGQWELVVKARVNQVDDQAIVPVEVKAQ